MPQAPGGDSSHQVVHGDTIQSFVNRKETPTIKSITSALGISHMQLNRWYSNGVDLAPLRHKLAVLKYMRNHRDPIQAIADQADEDYFSMTATELDEIQTRLGWTNVDLAQRLGVTRATISNWKQTPKRDVAEKLTARIRVLEFIQFYMDVIANGE